MWLKIRMVCLVRLLDCLLNSFHVRESVNKCVGA